MESTRYNPDGAQFDDDFAFPFEDEEFEIITLYSVFTHMLTDGVRAYLKEFKRLLTPDGRVFITAFIEEGVPDMVENPEGYLGYEWKGSLHCVRYNQEFFERLVDEAGLKLERIGKGTGKGPGQLGRRGVYLSRKS